MSNLASRPRPFRIDSFDDSIGFDNHGLFLDPPNEFGDFAKGFERKNRSGSTKPVSYTHLTLPTT